MSPRRSQRFKDREDRKNLIAAHVLAVLTTVVGCGYIIWAARTANWEHPVASAAFLIAEVFCLTLFVVTTMSVWKLRYKPPEGLPPERSYSVDVLVPVCGEPIPVVRATLRAVQAIRWRDPLSVYVLDDRGLDEVRSLALEHGFNYLSRARAGIPVHSAKAGNLNFGLMHASGELVLVLDADQVPQPNILEALVGYMRFPGVAFIQSKQAFVLPDGDPFFNQDRVFYDAVQLGYDNYDSTISCGSGVLYRRAALDQSGGFAEWNLVEDLTTSYELHGKGWKSFYYPHQLSRGNAPADIWGVYRQRGQWAFDTLRLFYWDNPLFKRGLTWARRMTYLVIPLSYISAGLIFPFFFAVPVWTYLTGASVLTEPEWQFVLIRGIYFVAMALALRILFRKNQTGRQFQMLVGLFPVYVAAAFRALVYPPGRLPAYVANNGTKPHRRPPAIVAILPQLALLLANAGLPLYALAAATASPRLIVGNAFVSALAIWSLLPIVLATFTRKVWSEEDNVYELRGAAPDFPA